MRERVKKEKYHFEVSNRLAALEDLDAEVEINSALEMFAEDIQNFRQGECRLL
jgi:hypothetical protein